MKVFLKLILPVPIGVGVFFGLDLMLKNAFPDLQNLRALVSIPTGMIFSLIVYKLLE